MQERKPPKNSKIKKVTVVGVIPSFAFQRAKYCALELHRKLPHKFPLPHIIGLVELDWSEKLLEWRQTFGREYWCLRRPVAVFFDDRFVGSDIELLKLSSIGNILIENIPRKNMCFMKEESRKDYISYLKKTKRMFCYLDICVDEAYIGTLTFQLYSDLLPRTCENFKTLCLGTRGPLFSYRGSRIHRIVKKGWLQGGDIQYKTGGGGFSIFCDPLEDENFAISHDRKGVLSMANAGRHQNGSQFFITLNPTVWMDTHFVAFGQLIEGVNVLNKLENLETSYECPLRKIEIKSCGKMDLGDVEDVDAMYKEEPLPTKKHKQIETITQQVVRLIMEALTDALAKKERFPDILDDGDVPSKMNIHLYFQGFYSIPPEILEQSSQYLRNLGRELLRTSRPSATEIVEVMMYDLLLAVLSRMANLDDIRETLGHDYYKKLISNIDMNLKACSKPQIKRLVNQIASTAETIVNLVSKKLIRMKRFSKKRRRFLSRLQEWAQSFVLQETFKGDCYHIARRSDWSLPQKSAECIGHCKLPEVEEEKKVAMPHREGRKCCIDEKELERKKMAELRNKFPQEDVCCIGSKLLIERDVELSSYFHTCWYDSKKHKKEQKFRMPLLDLIEMSRYRLKCLRNHLNRVKSKERICLEKKIAKWMTEVIYISETMWVRDMVFEEEDVVCKHVEEIMYGAMTAGLLEMYYYVEQYLKKCGGKRKRLVTKTVYPEEVFEVSINREGKQVVHDVTQETEEVKESEEESEKSSTTASDSTPDKAKSVEAMPSDPFVIEGVIEALEAKTVEEEGSKEETIGEAEEEGEREVEEDVKTKDEESSREESKSKEGDRDGFLGKRPCRCGHRCCVCKFEPVSENISLRHSIKATEESRRKSFGRRSMNIKYKVPEIIEIKVDDGDCTSIKWLENYIMEEDCDLKSEFAAQVHQWLDGEEFNYRRFFSQHSLVTKASLLSLSLSLAALIKDNNKLKTEIKDFIYDLWSLYFNEMFKEAILEYPMEFNDTCALMEKDKVDDVCKTKDKDVEKDDICQTLLQKDTDFDFDAYCAKLKDKSDEKKQISLKKKEQSEGKDLDSDEERIEKEIHVVNEKPSKMKRKSTLHPVVQIEGKISSDSQKYEKSDKGSVASEKPVTRKSILSQRRQGRKSEDSQSDRGKKKSVISQRVLIDDGKSTSSQKEEIEKRKSMLSSHRSITDDQRSVRMLGEDQDERSIKTMKSDLSKKKSILSSRSGRSQRGEESQRSFNFSVPEDISLTFDDLEKEHTEDLPIWKGEYTRKKKPIVTQEYAELSDSESRNMPPYVLPFWVRFLTELTKQALAAIAKVSRLPRRLYFLSESVMSFDDKMKDWLEFNAFNPQPTKGREITDYFVLHHKDLINLDESARSYLKKKKYSGLINRCTRIVSADEMADEIVTDVIGSAIDRSKGNRAMGSLVSGLISAAVSSSTGKVEGQPSGQYSFNTQGSKSSAVVYDEAEGKNNLL